MIRERPSVSGKSVLPPGGKTDPLGRAGRRRLMQAVRQSGTDPELLVRRALWRAGLRYRLHRRIGPTTPDLVFVRDKVAVFVDGCFWHGCPDHYTAPKHNAPFWRDKIEKNRDRDTRVTGELRAQGWCVLRFWSCELRDLDRIVKRVSRAVTRPRSILP